MDKNSCPICEKELIPIERYPNYVCQNCAEKATDSNGQKIEFENVSLSGGYLARYPNTGEIYDSHICYIEGVKCIADEAKFGGIVIQIV